MRVDAPLVLKDNFLLNIGESFIVVNFSSGNFLDIKVFGTPYRGEIFSFNPQEFQIIRIGRSYECDIKLEDPLLSKI